MVKFLLAGLLCATLTACGTEDDEDVKLEPTLASIQKNIFDRSCASSGCHGDAKEGNLDLRSGKSHAMLINAEPDDKEAAAAGLKRITPGDPSKSFLFLKLTSVPSGMGQRMPTGARPLSTEKINVIKKWIEDGANQ